MRPQPRSSWPKVAGRNGYGRVVLLYGRSAAEQRDGPNEPASDCPRVGRRGLSDEEIARELGVSTRMVRLHFANIRARLGASSRIQAVAIALERGLIRLPRK